MVQERGFTQSAAEPMILIGPGPKGKRLKMSIHVDDPWITGPKEMIEDHLDPE